MSKHLRRYGTLVRMFAGVLAVLLFLPAALVIVVILIKYEDKRNVETVVGFIGACGGMVVLLRIAATRNGTEFLEQTVGTLGDDQHLTSESGPRE